MTLRSLLILAIMVPGVFIALFNRFFALLLYIWFALFRPQPSASRPRSRRG